MTQWEKRKAQRDAKLRNPKHPLLPGADLEYTQIETAKANGYRWTEWLAEDPMVRARLVAHEIERGLREAYEMDHRPREEKATASSISAFEDMVFGRTVES